MLISGDNSRMLCLRSPRARGLVLALALFLSSQMAVLSALGPGTDERRGPTSPQRPKSRSVDASGKKASSSQQSISEARSPSSSSSSSPLPSPTSLKISSLFSQVGEVLQSKEFQELQGVVKDVLEDVTGQELPDFDVKKGIDHVSQHMDKTLATAVNSLESVIQAYDGLSRSDDVGGLVHFAREKVLGMVKTTVHKLLSDRAIHACLLSVNATAVLAAEEHARTSHLGRTESRQEVMRRMSVVADDAEAIGTAAMRLPVMRWYYTPAEIEYIEGLLSARLVPRLVLAVAAAVVHGWQPLEDPLLALLVVAFASGSLTKQLLGNLLSIMEVSLMGKNVLQDGVIEDSIPDIWQTGDTVEQIGERLFNLFEALETRAAWSTLEAEGKGDDGDAWAVKRIAGPAPSTEVPPSSTRQGTLLRAVAFAVHCLRNNWKAVLTLFVGLVVLLGVMLATRKVGGRGGGPSTS